MSDNIIIDPEIWRLYVLFMSIPNETWTDVLKLLSRRILVQKIAPACKRLKNISNRHVDNVHVIKEAGRFNEKLQQGDPEANQQLQHLAGNNCQLASQFRLTRIDITQENMAILRHCIELFRGCRLSFSPIGNQNAALIDECLTQLEPANPNAIYISLCRDPQLLFNQFLRHPTIWECSRISLFHNLPYPCSVNLMPIVVPFLDWLHHQPIGVDGSIVGGEQEEVRCLIIDGNYKLVQEAIDWLIDGCIRNLQQSQGPKDRRRFVLQISLWQWNRAGVTRLLSQFERRHNQATGEILLLEPADAANPIARVCRLRRCLAEEVDNGREFYEKTFTPNGSPLDEFVNEDDGSIVEID